MNNKAILIALFLLLSVSACSLNEDLTQSEEEILAELMLPDPGTLPGVDNNNAYDKVELGRLLYWDPILSGEKDVSCATCHHPDFGYADGRALPLGVGAVGLGPQRRDVSNGRIPVVGRNSPTVMNTVYNGTTARGTVPQSQAPMFWDNRARSLETQALGPPLSFEEMRGHAFDANVALDSIEARLRDNREYRRLFEGVYGRRNSISSENIADAIAAFERTIVADNSPFDRFMAGDAQAISAQARRGFQRFNDVGCGTCHQGPMFSDYLPHALGVPETPLREEADGGVNNTWAFRTPTLRNITLTPPYFHNGTSQTLNDVMQFYLRAQNVGPGPNSVPPTNPNVREVDPLLANMTLQAQDIPDIIAFMESLEDNDFDKEIPNSVPSGLPVGGLIGGGGRP